MWDDLAGTVNDFIPRISGPKPCSGKSIWQRINRIEAFQRTWESDVVAVASVDADLFEQWAYHPCPINCEQFFVDAGILSWSDTQTHKRIIKDLKLRFRELLLEQDDMWNRADVDGKRWEILEMEITTVKERLDYEQSLLSGEGTA